MKALGGLALLFCLSGCSSAWRLYDVGSLPPLTHAQDPTAYPGYRPIQIPTPPARSPHTKPSASLWQPGARKFLKDQRASKIGDILTVRVSLGDSASLTNNTTYGRTSQQQLSLKNLLGYEKTLGNVLPKGFTPQNALNIKSTPSYKGSATLNRSENVDLTVAVMVSQILPNGYLAVIGRQEVRVNAEVRVVILEGIVRPEDILADNSVSSDKIAELRVSYGGIGNLSDVQQAPYGQQVLDQVMPF